MFAKVDQQSFFPLNIFSLFTGNRDSYPYQGSRRSGGYVGEDEGYPPGGRSRDSFAGAKDPQQNYAREEKQGQRYRDHQGAKIDQDEFDERGRRKSGHRASRERKGN